MITQLTEQYLNDNRFKKKLTKAQAEEYFKVLKAKGNILCAYQRDMVIGKVEFYLVSEEQAIRLATDKEFHVADENTTDGNICYILDVWVHKDFRKQGVIRLLKRALFDKTKHVIAYMGLEQKRHDRLRVRRNHNGSRETVH